MYTSEKELIHWLKTAFIEKIPFLKHGEIQYPNSKRGDTPDIILVSTHAKRKYHFCIEVKRAGYPQYIRSAIALLEQFRKNNPNCYPIVVTPRISEQGKIICDEHHVGYVDAIGNAKIVTGSIFIEKEHSSNIMIPSFIKNESHGQSIFSPKSTRITKYILSEPNRILLQKDIAAKTGLSKGMVSRIVKRMIETGYLVERERGVALSNFDDLLSAWVDASIKRRQAERRYYIWAQNTQRLMRNIAERLEQKKVQYAFTQEAGASLVAPFSTFEIVSLYIESFEKVPAAVLAAEDAKKGFNIVLFEPADTDIFRQAREIDNQKVVDDLQLYLDLMKNPLRGERQAVHLLSLLRKKVK
jgi:hypothetical protein